MHLQQHKLPQLATDRTKVGGSKVADDSVVVLEEEDLVSEERVVSLLSKSHAGDCRMRRSLLWLFIHVHCLPYRRLFQHVVATTYFVVRQCILEWSSAVVRN